MTRYYALNEITRHTCLLTNVFIWLFKIFSIFVLICYIGSLLYSGLVQFYSIILSSLFHFLIINIWLVYFTGRHFIHSDLCGFCESLSAVGFTAFAQLFLLLLVPFIVHWPIWNQIFDKLWWAFCTSHPLFWISTGSSQKD